MKKPTKTAIMAILSILPLTASAFDNAKTLWYTAPALQWEETLPLGNGRLGMMPDGGLTHEKIVLNEISMWSGSEADYSNPEASKSLPEIQSLLLQGKNKEAQDIMYNRFCPDYSGKTGKGSYGTYGTYQLLADLDIDYKYPMAGVGQRRSDDHGYRRWLDLDEAVAYTTFQVDSVTYVREYFVPRSADAIVTHIYANRPGMVSLTATLSRPGAALLADADSTQATISSRDNALYLNGSLDSGQPDIPGVKYWTKVYPVTVGGKSSAVGNQIVIDNADEAWIVAEAATDYWQRIGLDPIQMSTQNATPGQLRQWKSDNIAMHRELMGRASINLPQTEISSLPTDVRIARFREESDPQLAALYYNYGRYLLISSTRPGLLPPNLQGLWANGTYTPWNGDYHTNINVQMNHWPAEQGNLSELHLPLIALTERAIPAGQKAAKDFYGDNAQGWVMHMMTNAWNYAAPGEHPSWGATNTGGAWLCQHLWEHHLFNPADSAYLRQIYPVLKGAADFFLSTMIVEPQHGWLVTAPSSSPENEFLVGDSKVSICLGPTMDTQIVRELFNNTVSAASKLGVDSDYIGQLNQALAKLPPMQIGSDGRLMEWLEEYTEADPHHRHVSHLYGLHPGNEISAARTPDLAQACRRTLDVRGDEGTGWSRAWKINFWARLGDGDRALKLFRSLLQPAYLEQGQHHGSGTFPNLFCSHPPFQIDGNFGGASGIGEMLVQSQDGFVNLLPALPAEWPDGSLYGIKVRGGATVNMVWHNGKVDMVQIVNDNPAQPVTLKLPEGYTSFTASSPEAIVASEGFAVILPAPSVTINFEY